MLAILQVMRASCWMYTLCALNWLFSYADPQMWWLVKWLKAMVTFMWLLTTVCYQMNPENFSSCDRKITHCALIPPLPKISVYEVMLHNTCLTKCFIALLTSIFKRVSKQVHLERTLLTKLFNAFFTLKDSNSARHILPYWLWRLS